MAVEADEMDVNEGSLSTDGVSLRSTTFLVLSSPLIWFVRPDGRRCTIC